MPDACVLTRPPEHQNATLDRPHHRRLASPVSPAAVVAVLASLALMLFGGLNVARAGFGGAWRAPLVEVAGYQGTVVLGLVVLGVAATLLLAACSNDTGAILLVSSIIGLAGATLAFEPSVGGELVAAERNFGIAVLILAGCTASVSAAARSLLRAPGR